MDCFHCGADSEDVLQIGNVFDCENCEKQFTREDTLPKTDGLHIYTDAPESYDGFGTATISVTDYRTKKTNKPIRLVNIPTAAQHSNWQTIRYASGLHLALTQEQWADLTDLIAEPIAPASPPAPLLTDTNAYVLPGFDPPANTQLQMVEEVTR